MTEPKNIAEEQLRKAICHWVCITVFEYKAQHQLMDRDWHAKTMELVKKHVLGFLHNPGGGEFTHYGHDYNGKVQGTSDQDYRIQVYAWDDKEDYEMLLAGLRKLGLEP